MVEKSLRLTKCLKFKVLHLSEINNVLNTSILDSPINCMLSINRMYDGYILQSFKKHEAFVFRNNQDSLHIADWFYIEFIT